MFRIRRIYDDVSRASRDAIEQVKTIMVEQFPLASEAELRKLPGQLADPLKYRYKSILFVAEDARSNVKGFALLLHLTDLKFCYLEFISTAPGLTGGGIGGVLYERVREEARRPNDTGLFFEVLPDEPHLCLYPDLLKQNSARLRFHERYNARPIINKVADSERLVSTEMPFAGARITSARPRPASPTTKPRRRTRMMPRMVRMLGVNTKPNVPRVPVCAPMYASRIWRTTQDTARGLGVAHNIDLRQRDNSLRDRAHSLALI
jgi:GNAT superfamily N-acetyltransferase